MSSLINSLNRLLVGNVELTASAFTVKQRTELEQFARDTRLISITKKGRSIKYQISNKEGVINFINSQQPLTDQQLDSSLPDRSRNIGKEKNSKKGITAHESCYLLMKSWNQNLQWLNESSEMIPAVLTDSFGVASVEITISDRWQTNGPIWFVENQALFDQSDWLPNDFNGCLIYYAGQLPNVLMTWLSEAKRCPEIVLFPDYDGIGLSNFARLAESLNANTPLSLYWMPDWEYKLETFGNSEIWLKTRVMFENAYKKLERMERLDSDLIKLAKLSQLYGKALEQESIWL